MDQIRVDQQNLPKKERYGIGELLKTIDLKRPTYYDERKRIINKNDKYADAKVVIKKIAEKGKYSPVHIVFLLPSFTLEAFF